MLVTQGFVEKGQQDGRTNAYTLTQVGQRAIADRIV
jgi:predicted transcriptional regulator